MPVRKQTTHNNPINKGSGLRPRATTKPMTVNDLTPLVPARPPSASADADAPPHKPENDPELQNRLHALVTFVNQNEGSTYPIDWAPTVGIAVALGYVRETRGRKLFPTKHGEMWLAQRARAPVGGQPGKYDLTKISGASKLNLKAIAHDTSVPMQEVIGYIVDAVYDHRDELTRVAQRAGLDHPWEAIGVLLRGR